MKISYNEFKKIDNYSGDLTIVKLVRYPLSHLAFSFLPNSTEVLTVLEKK